MLNSTFANDLIKLIFQANAIAGIADNASSGALTSLYISLHTGDPGAAGTQSSNEANYTGYARVALVRSAVGWTVSANVVSPAARIEFGEMTGGTEQLATWFAVGTAASGTGKILVRGRLSPDIQCRIGVIPAIKPDTTITFTTASA